MGRRRYLDPAKRDALRAMLRSGIGPGELQSTIGFGKRTTARLQNSGRRVAPPGGRPSREGARNSPRGLTP